jgi:hypothetical protein
MLPARRWLITACTVCDGRINRPLIGASCSLGKIEPLNAAFAPIASTSLAVFRLP